MALILECKITNRIPIEVADITPCRLVTIDLHSIPRMMIRAGNRACELGEIFKISGFLQEDQTIRWQGSLENVHWIGSGQTFGNTLIESAAGRHVGEKMSGGKICALRSVGDYAGCQMRGGELQICGNAGNHVASSYPGASQGMAGGEILILGSAGWGLGQRVRRGFVAVAGSVGAGCGTGLLAGTLLVFGGCTPDCGIGMKRGTIILAGLDESLVSPHFSSGSIYRGHMLPIIGGNLEAWPTEYKNFLGTTSFRLQHGDLMNGGKGEILTVHKN